MLGAIARIQTPSRWAVIKDARRRQWRRRRRIAAAVLLATAAGLLIEHDLQPGPTPTAPKLATGAVEHLRLGGAVQDTTTLQHNLWVLTCLRRCRQAWSTATRGQLIELTGAGRPVKRYPVTDPGAITSGDGAIWLAHFDGGDVSRIDPQTGQATATLSLRLPKPITASGDRRFLPLAMSFSADRVWVSGGRGWTAEINPQTGRLIRMVYSSSEATSATTDAGQTWIADELDGVGTYTAGSSRVIPHAISWRGQPLSIDAVARGSGLIWAWGSRDLLVRGDPTATVVTTINPRTDRVEHQWRVDNTGPMIIGNDGAYSGDSDSGRLLHLSAPDHVQVLYGPKAASLVAVTRHALWAVNRKGQLLRIDLGPTQNY